VFDKSDIAAGSQLTSEGIEGDSRLASAVFQNERN
jgi:hypothetical protein